jgi:hypothetical protein
MSLEATHFVCGIDDIGLKVSVPTGQQRNHRNSTDSSA